jgi:hypothetical protein
MIRRERPWILALGGAGLVLGMLLVVRIAWAQDPPAGTRPIAAGEDVQAAATPLQVRERIERLEARIAIKRAELRELEIELAHAHRALTIAEPAHAAALRRARERLEWSERMFERGYISAAQRDADRARLERLEAEGPAVPQT